MSCALQGLFHLANRTSSHQFHLSFAASGAETFDALRASPTGFDLIMSDYELPDSAKPPCTCDTTCHSLLQSSLLHTIAWPFARAVLGHELISRAGEMMLTGTSKIVMLSCHDRHDVIEGCLSAGIYLSVPARMPSSPLVASLTEMAGFEPSVAGADAYLLKPLQLEQIWSLPHYCNAPSRKMRRNRQDEDDHAAASACRQQ